MTASQSPSHDSSSAQRPSNVVPVPLTELARFCGIDLDSKLQVTGISLDSRTILPGDLYLALPGDRVHGAKFAASAVASGAVAILTDQAGTQIASAEVPQYIPVLGVAEPRALAGPLAAKIYQRPHLNLFGLTGTNGKTTTSYLIRSILAALERSSGLIGTIEMLAGETVIPSTLTTPEATDVHALVALMAEKNLGSVVMEVSSHALAYGRVDGLVFDVAGFTNLTQDHLDLHGTMAEYAATKAELFSSRRSKRAVVTVDDQWGRQIAARADVPVLRLQIQPTEAPLEDPSDWRVLKSEPLGLGWRIELHGFDADGTERSFKFTTSLPGEFNIANSALAVLMVYASGVDAGSLQRALDERDPLSINVPGRMQLISKAPVAVVDFAHNPDALQRAMDAVRPNNNETRGRLITVFGATGQRDQTKRPIMGALAARGSDVVIITDDDPHDEDPEQIRDQVFDGAAEAVKADQLETVLELVAPRAAAIDRAVALAGKDDAILIAGRGHENWQEVQGVNIALDDRDELRQALVRYGLTAVPVPEIES